MSKKTEQDPKATLTISARGAFTKAKRGEHAAVDCAHALDAFTIETDGRSLRQIADDLLLSRLNEAYVASTAFDPEDPGKDLERFTVEITHLKGESVPISREYALKVVLERNAEAIEDGITKAEVFEKLSVEKLAKHYRMLTATGTKIFHEGQTF